MRVALVASLVSPIRAAEANGPHSVILDLADGLAGRGHALEIYAAAGSIAAHPLVEIPVEADAADAAFRPDRQADLSSRAALRRAFERLFDELRRRGPDVVSQHAYDAPAIELSEGLPTLHTLHLSPTDADVVRASSISSGRFVTVSNAAQRAWTDAGVHGVGMIRNGVPGVPLAESPPLRFALVAGRVSPEKGTHIAIQAARAAGLAVRVVGDIYDRRYYASEVAPLLEPDQSVESLPRAELMRLMSRAAVVLMPVRWEEAFGLVAAEAQMAGCPVVGFRRGALPEVVDEGVGGFLVEPENEAALVPAIHAALRLDRTGIRDHALTTFGVGRMVDEYERALAAIIFECTAGSSLPLR